MEKLNLIQLYEGVLGYRKNLIRYGFLNKNNDDEKKIESET